VFCTVQSVENGGMGVGWEVVCCLVFLVGILCAVHVGEENEVFLAWVSETPLSMEGEGGELGIRDVSYRVRC